MTIIVNMQDGIWQCHACLDAT